MKPPKFHARTKYNALESEINGLMNEMIKDYQESNTITADAMKIAASIVLKDYESKIITSNGYAALLFLGNLILSVKDETDEYIDGMIDGNERQKATRPVYCPHRGGMKVKCETPNACAGGADCRRGVMQSDAA